MLSKDSWLGWVLIFRRMRRIITVKFWHLTHRKSTDMPHHAQMVALAETNRMIQKNAAEGIRHPAMNYYLKRKPTFAGGSAACFASAPLSRAPGKLRAPSATVRVDAMGNELKRYGPAGYYGLAGATGATGNLFQE